MRKLYPTLTFLFILLTLGYRGNAQTEEDVFPEFSSNVDEICENGTVTFTFTNKDEYEEYYFQWEFEGGEPSTSTEENPTVTYSTSGYYKVSLAVYAEEFTETIKDISVISVPTITFNKIPDQCINGADLPLNFATPEGGKYGGTAVTNNTFSPSDAGLGEFNIVYTLTTEEGCKAKAFEKVKVHDFTPVTFSPIPFQVVGNEPLTLDFATPKGGIYSGKGVKDNKFDPNVAGEGQHTIKYEYTNPEGCVSEASQNVDVIDNSGDKKVKRNMVVLEIFTGTWCGFCPAAAMGADDLAENDKPVAIIEHHIRDDYTIEAGKFRKSYYSSSISGYPTAIFDGVNVQKGGSYNTSLYSKYLSKVEHRIAELTSIELNIYGKKINDTTYDVIALAKNIANNKSKDLRVNFALTESHINKEWQNQDELNFVNRKMSPSSEGVKFTFDNNVAVITSRFTIDPLWSVDNLEFIAFVQDYDSKEIFNADKSNLKDLKELISDIPEFSSDNTDLCQSGTVQFIDQSIGEDNTYLWTFQGGDPATSTDKNPTVTYNNIGEYDVTLKVTRNGVESVAKGDKYIKVHNSPTIDFKDIPEQDLQTTNLKLDFATPEGGVYNGKGVKNNVFYPSEAGIGTHIISYEYKDEYGCSSIAEKSVIVKNYTGIDDINIKGFTISPNPTTGNINIQFDSNRKEKAYIYIHNGVGQVIQSDEINIEEENRLQYNLSGAPKGVYYIHIKSESLSIKEKVIVR